MKFTLKEIAQLLLATIALIIIFSFQAGGFDLENFYAYVIAVLTGFLLHELAHKYMASRFGCEAFFKIWPQGLVTGFLLMFFGIKCAAPGYISIFPYKFARWGFRRRHLTIREEGIIALSGLLVNLFFTILFFFIPANFAKIIALTNCWILVFNLIPIPPLDGSKILMWDHSIWVSLLILSCALLFVLLI